MLDLDKTIELIRSDRKKDLHIHTCYSDGILTPEEVIYRWQSEGYEVISITDHDGIEGSVRGMKYAKEAGMYLLQGAEFDSEDPLGKDIHILAYGFDPVNIGIRKKLREIAMNRARRNDALMAALNDMGYDISLNDIGEVNEGRYIGKPTFAMILAIKGMISDPQEAFRTIFRDDRIRRISKLTYSSEEIIRLIHGAGGIAVLAHPVEQRRRDESYEEFRPRMYALLDRMREYGIDGIECYHPSADSYQSEELRQYAERHGLLITRGSDFHSDRHPRDYSRFHTGRHPRDYSRFHTDRDSNEM